MSKTTSVFSVVLFIRNKKHCSFLKNDRVFVLVSYFAPRLRLGPKNELGQKTLFFLQERKIPILTSSTTLLYEKYKIKLKLNTNTHCDISLLPLFFMAQFPFSLLSLSLSHPFHFLSLILTHRNIFTYYYQNSLYIHHKLRKVLQMVST